MFYTPEGFVRYRGHPAMQNQLAFPLFKMLFARESFDTVIEIGTAFGGTSLFLADQAAIHGFTFRSYDPHPVWTDALSESGVVVERSCFAPESLADIEAAIARGRVLLLCDGASKAHEFAVFGGMLTSGDMIMAHDYAATRERYDAEVVGRYWAWLEVTDGDVASTLAMLEPYSEVPFWKAAWLCARKP